MEAVRVVRPQPAERRDPVDVGKLDVHEDQRRPQLDGQLDRLAPRRGLERAIPGCQQDVAEQLHARRVVLDDEYLFPGHG